jgi:hypothetical protein
MNIFKNTFKALNSYNTEEQKEEKTNKQQIHD